MIACEHRVVLYEFVFIFKERIGADARRWDEGVVLEKNVHDFE